MIMNTDTSFVKYHGLGNDFILVDNRYSSTPIFSSTQSIQLCNRNFGIGGDGVIFVLPGTNDCDYTMRIYNSDGSEPQMCGNGIRCMAKFLTELEHLSPGQEVSYKIWTNAGVIIPKILPDGLITVDMGEPVISPPHLIPTLLPATENGSVVEADINVDGTIYKATAVSMGNPHSIIFVDSFASMIPPFPTVGPLVEKHVMFPERVNAEFVEVLSPSHVSMKVWERGAGPTLACGTGACAVVVAGVLTKRTERNCKVTLPGGDLQIEWKEEDNKLYMTGPADAVFRGSLDSALVK